MNAASPNQPNPPFAASTTIGGDEGTLDAMNPLLQALDRARVMTRAMWKSGAIWNFRPEAVPVLVRQRLSGSAGPSTLVRLNAKNRPDHEALVGGSRRLTYAALDRRCDRLAAGLFHHHGLRSGDSTILMMRNRPEFIEAQVAMSRLGGGAVSVSYRSTVEELSYLVEHSGARAVIVDGEAAAVARAVRDRCPTLPAENLIVVGDCSLPLVSYEHIIDGGDLAIEESGEAGAVVIYTSGTTGKPKGAVRKFPREMQDAVMRFLIDTPLSADDRHLAVCPMYHSTAFGFIGFTMLTGGTVVILDHFDPEHLLAAIAQERITTTALVPTMLHRILELPDSVISRHDTHTLRAVFSGGAPLSGTLARRFMERFGHVLYNFYGATETGLNTLATPDELLASPGTIGHAIDGNEIRLLDDAGRPVPTGETGELWVKNAMLVAGYHRDEEATAQSMQDGFFSVGDLAHRDRHGLFHIDGRKRDMIISGGVNIYPAEVEEVLLSHPAIAEAAVIGVADDEWGERVQAFVSLHEGADATAEEVISFAKGKLSGPKVPRTVYFMDELPKNPTGKILKRELREMVP